MMKFSLCMGLLLSTTVLTARLSGQDQSANSVQSAALDPLPSWNDGDAKRSIIAFVQKVISPGGPDFVPAPERVAVFDNDGTLWAEAPLPFQVAFAFDELKRRAPQEPERANNSMVQAALSGDVAKLLAGKHHDGLLEVVALTHAGMTTDVFDQRVRDWFATAVHPKLSRPYSELTYQPMQELLDHLRANGFKTFIVSGGGADFMRVCTEQIYGIPPENVVGSMGQAKYELRDGVPTLIKTLDHLFVDDKEGKPVGIHQFIGRRPIACFGNSDGDQAMMEYTTIGNPRPSFGLIVHHTDAEREFEYDSKPPSSGKLITALEVSSQRGWTVVDMKNDWKQVFAGPVSRSVTSESVDPRSNATHPPTLAGKWIAEDIEGRGVIDNAQSTLEIDAQGAVSGNTAVNRYSGKATIVGNAWSLGPLATTRRAGLPALMDQENKFVAALGNASRYRFDENGLLFLLDAYGRELIRFSRMAD